MAEALELLINGERHSGFLSGSVTQTFGASLVATTFQVSYATRADAQAEPVVIEAGDAVTLRVGDEDLVRGWVVDESESYDSRERRYTVGGSSAVVDLLDCSAVHSSRRFRDQTLFEIATALVEGYDVRIHDRAASDERIARFAIQEGESIAEALGRAARLRGVVLADEAGDLVITRVGAERTETVLERGRNILEGERSRSGRERYSEYRFTGQTRADDDVNGLAAAQIGHTIGDRGVTRLRRLVVHAHTDRREDIGTRAQLERNMRAGRSEKLVYDVAGWRDDAGNLWRPNTRVRALDGWLRVDAELLITRAAYTFDLRRYRTQLELTRPEAFSELEYPIRPRGARWR